MTLTEAHDVFGSVMRTPFSWCGITADGGLVLNVWADNFSPRAIHPITYDGRAARHAHKPARTPIVKRTGFRELMERLHALPPGCTARIVLCRACNREVEPRRVVRGSATPIRGAVLGNFRLFEDGYTADILTQLSQVELESNLR